MMRARPKHPWRTRPDAHRILPRSDPWSRIQCLAACWTAETKKKTKKKKPRRDRERHKPRTRPRAGDFRTQGSSATRTCGLRPDRRAPEHREARRPATMTAPKNSPRRASAASWYTNKHRTGLRSSPNQRTARKAGIEELQASTALKTEIAGVISASHEEKRRCPASAALPLARPPGTVPAMTGRFAERKSARIPPSPLFVRLHDGLSRT